MIPLVAGFLPLTDAALLIAAARLGFAEEQGLALALERENSWATLRDKLVLGHLDAAHMLAPLALATTLGLGPGPARPLEAAAALNLNGNAVTLSARLWTALDLPDDADPPAVAAVLGAVVEARRRAGDPPLTLATVFPVSTHTFLLRRFLRSGGIDPDTAVRVTVVPPPSMAEALARGTIDGFCVGSPWNSVAVRAGHGRIVAFGRDLVPDAPEKLLAVRRNRTTPGTTGRLATALAAAAAWCARPENRDALAALLAEPRHLDIPADLIRFTLEGRLPLGPDGPVRSAPDYLLIGPDILRPRPDHARWLAREMVRAGQAPDEPAVTAAALELYRAARPDAGS